MIKGELECQFFSKQVYQTFFVTKFLHNIPVHNKLYKTEAKNQINKSCGYFTRYKTNQSISSCKKCFFFWWRRDFLKFFLKTSESEFTLEMFKQKQ